ncbi:MAG TPA: hypothetical protein VKZ53_05125 [Candidatus Angelobacter sp.]|nr:hypothetical protein [Candidatus Angelobacter sp.]
MTSFVTAPALRISRLEDRYPSGGYEEDWTVQQFCGDWITTNGGSKGIAKAKIDFLDAKLIVHAFGAPASAPIDWGPVVAGIFTDGPNSSRIRAFHAFYDFGFMESYLQAKTEKAVLVVASFNRFKDQSGRANYFSREFFHRIA